MATQYSEIDQETGLTVNPKNAQSENVVNRRLLVIVVFAWIFGHNNIYDGGRNGKSAMMW